MKLKQYNPKLIEDEVRRYWAEHKIIEKSFNARRGSKIFSFLEGPPTCNGFMHVGHARGRTLKDVVIKFKLMQGFDVWNRAGWDTQGLPVELEAEKTLGLSSKKDIERVGYERFVEECNRLVDYYMKHWREASERLGLWLDYDNAYETRRREYIEFVWWALKQAYDRGWLVEDLKVIAFCPRCETPLSDQEVALGYATVEDPSIYVKMPLADEPGTYIVIWTTTPWTLPANEAICVHPYERYVKIEVADEKWIVAEKLLEKVMKEVGVKEYRVLETFDGLSLERLRYIHPLLDEVPVHKLHEGAHMVVCDEMVSMEEGTGCVHMAPAHGPEDFEVGRRYGLPVFCPVDATGRYTEDAAKYKGLYVKDADKVIVEDLKRKGLLIYEGRVLHEYPHCWRCNTPLIYKADRQWFLRIEPIKSLILEENGKVKWAPPWAGEARFHNWIANARDWCISRLRVWGSPLNIWTCTNCGQRVCVGSYEELRRMSIKPVEDVEPHRPWIDEIKLKCPRCGGEMIREPHVLDCWLDSGVAHAASVGYLRDKRLFEKLFPYDFVTEAVDQTRGWFFSLIFTSVMVFGRAPYKSVLCQGHVLDKVGQKMSKSKGNVVWALDAMEREGVDPLRLYLTFKSAPWDSLNFDFDELKNTRRTLNTIFNVYKFAYTYMKLDKFKAHEAMLSSLMDKLSIEDKWLLSRCQSVVREVTEKIEALNIHEAARAVIDFLIDDISRGYIRFIRRRVWLEEEAIEKVTAYATLYYVLERAVRLLAPFVPYFAEWLFLNFTREFSESSPASVFMCEWPRADKQLEAEELEEGAKHLMDVLTLVANARQKAKLKSRWPVSKVIVVALREGASQKLKMFHKVLLEQANAREVFILDSMPHDVELKLRVKEDVLKELYGDKHHLIVEELSKIPVVKAVEELIAYGKIRLNVKEEPLEVSSDAIEVVEELRGNVVSAYGKGFAVYLDTTRDRELEAEALTRDLVRRIQYMRKEMDLAIEDYIDVVIEAPESVKNTLTHKNVEYLKGEVRAKLLTITSSKAEVSEDWYHKSWDIDGVRFSVYLKKAT
ncbi:MAG: isoleucine--tRNA ligase [Thermoprotei archaeon]|nr:MAG: isoleucine--tRNA ligase [Thermoprotei archaeon]